MAGTTGLKRQKELKREDRQREKEMRREQRRHEKDERQRDIEAGVDPDIAGIVPGPQPPPLEG